MYCLLYQSLTSAGPRKPQSASRSLPRLMSIMIRTTTFIARGTRTRSLLLNKKILFDKLSCFNNTKPKPVQMSSSSSLSGETGQTKRKPSSRSTAVASRIQRADRIEEKTLRKDIRRALRADTKSEADEKLLETNSRQARVISRQLNQVRFNSFKNMIKYDQSYDSSRIINCN